MNQSPRCQRHINFQHVKGYKCESSHFSLWNWPFSLLQTSHQASWSRCYFISITFCRKITWSWSRAQLLAWETCLDCRLDFPQGVGESYLVSFLVRAGVRDRRKTHTHHDVEQNSISKAPSVTTERQLLAACSRTGTHPSLALPQRLVAPTFPLRTLRHFLALMQRCFEHKPNADVTPTMTWTHAMFCRFLFNSFSVM